MEEIKLKKILVVEDERSLAKALELKLKSAGFGVTLVFDGNGALKAMGENNFDLVLLDLLMPRLSGFDVLAELKKRGDKTPVIVASNLGQIADIERAKSLGAVDYFVKSDISIADVVLQIRKTLSLL